MAIPGKNLNGKANSRKGIYKVVASVLLLISLVQYIIYIEIRPKLNQNTIVTLIKQPPPKELTEYLVSSSQCRISNLHPFNEEAQQFHKRNSYKSCTNQPLLTYITVDEENQAILHINQSSIQYYSKDSISCCYSSVSRKTNKKNPDDAIGISGCEFFQTEAVLSEDVIVVKCKNNFTQKEIYKNAHAFIRIKENFSKKLNIITTQQLLSVLIIGIDSVSRLNFMRQMPKSLWFLKTNRWLEFQGYNKIADNTYPNLMGILSGMNKSTSIDQCKPTEAGYLDKCKLLWYDYRDLGYITAYAEDESSINTFNYNKKGFVKPPTDYYFRPYLLSAERELNSSQIDGMTYCTGPETSGERILNLASDFAKNFEKYPYFGFFWMNTFSHSKLNSLSRMDDKVRDFLENLWKNQILNNTLVLFLSDHGLRFGEIRYTRTGWLEERLPMLFMSVPKWFAETHPEKYNNLVINQNRLTTPYDLHMMLQDILVISGTNYSIKPSSACPNCRSLFEEVDINRSCEDACIEQHWCTCGGYELISKENSTVQAAVDYSIDRINNIIRSQKKCRKFVFKRLISASISKTHENSYKNDTYLLLVLETSPKAIFESTVSLKLNDNKLDFNLLDGISRLDSYAHHSKCMRNYKLKIYCYCKK